MIEVENLSKFYGPRPAISNLTFRVDKGDVVGFLGPNGAGKTTTMNILTCILPATSGTAKICGHDVFEQSMEIRKIIGYLPETPPVYSDMTVMDYLGFAGQIHRVPRAKLRSAIDRVVGQCVLGEVRHRIIGKLSKGFQQRVGLAQAMIHDPEILILDEPTVGLDPIQIIEIRKLIKELGSSHTILLSSHILPEITQICNRAIIISDGQIAAVDTLEGLTSSMRKSERLTLKVRQTDSGIAGILNSLHQVQAVTETHPGEYMIECEINSHLQDEVARLALEHSWGIEELKPVAMTLEDVFLKLTLEEKEVTE
jgi:ABC-2 type transport system ATP-binding protein